jgi:hypothetical protein
MVKVTMVKVTMVKMKVVKMIKVEKVIGDRVKRRVTVVRAKKVRLEMNRVFSKRKWWQWKPVFRIRIRLCRIRNFLGFPDPYQL